MTTDQNRDLRDDLLHALDHAYVVGPLGFDTPEALLAAYDASRAVPVPPPADQTALRDRIRRALCEASGNGFMWGTDMLEPDEYGEVAAAVLAVLPEQTDRAAEALAAIRPQTLTALASHIDARAVAILRPDSQTYAEWQTMAALLRRVAAEEQPAETPMFGTPDCTCIPFTRQTDPPRILNRPTDTVDMISGWEIGRDCPHHKPAVGEQPETQEAPRG